MDTAQHDHTITEVPHARNGYHPFDDITLAQRAGLAADGPEYARKDSISVRLEPLLRCGSMRHNVGDQARSPSLGVGRKHSSPHAANAGLLLFTIKSARRSASQRVGERQGVLVRRRHPDLW